MRLPVDVWQGCSGYWQTAFMRENLLPLGHAAWQGYQTQGRGLVVCDVEVVAATSVDWSGDVVKYQTRYITAVAVPDYLEAHGLQASDRDRLVNAVQTYCPEQEMLTAIGQAGSIEINWLQNLEIAPPDCHRQVCNRWDEFALKSSDRGRRDDDS
ncbi:MAG: hypothetical protein AAFY20_00505 [Cyanobacteria bacterium J06639_14]